MTYCIIFGNFSCFFPSSFLLFFVVAYFVDFSFNVYLFSRPRIITYSWVHNHRRLDITVTVFG